MNKVAIEKATSRLRVAKEALKQLEDCNSYTKFVDVWYTFLTSTNNIYTALEQGAKDSPQSLQWFGAKREERKFDRLLRYVYVARNDDEHGLTPITESVPESFHLPDPVEGGSHHIKFQKTPEWIVFEALDGKPLPAIGYTPPHSKLIAVRDRRGVEYQPPNEHKGAHLADNSPMNVARLVVAHLEDLVAQAEALRTRRS